MKKDIPFPCGKYVFFEKTIQKRFILSGTNQLAIE
jgi:hypothetical protein